MTKNPTEGTALGVMIAFRRSLRLETRFLHYFGQQNLQIVEHIIQSVKNNLKISFSFFNIQKELFSNYPIKFNVGLLTIFSKGFDTFIVARKVMIKARIEKAIEIDEVKQVVFLGAGYDPRALLGALKYKSVNFFEIDRGFTYAQKINAMQTLPKHICDIQVTRQQENAIVFNHNVVCIDCDVVKDDLIQMLKNNGFDPSLKTLIIAEGLTLYFTRNDLNRLLNSLDSLITDDSEIIISFVGKFKPKAKREARLKQAGEHRSFSIRPEYVIYYVHNRGFEVIDKFTTKSSMTLENESWIRKYYENKVKRGTAYYTIKKAKSGFKYKSMDEVPEIQLDLPYLVTHEKATNE